jgi:hypothetical protein
MLPKIGPGKDAAVKNSVPIKAHMTPTMPLAASSPATTKDLRSRDTTNPATARTTTAMPGHGASPACSAPPIAMTTTNTTSEAAASPTASTVLAEAPVFQASVESRDVVYDGPAVSVAF